MRAMRVALVLGSLSFSGCLFVYANVPEDLVEAVREEIAREEPCSYAGKTYSAGSEVCMGSIDMRCNRRGDWVKKGEC